MKKQLLSYCIIVLLFSCSSDDDENNAFDGSRSSLEDLFSEEVVETLNELNFTINTGTNPPNLEGTFFVTRFILTDSNRPEDQIGNRFLDQEYTFLNQNFEDNTIDFEGEQKNGIDGEATSFLDGTGSFISGDDNRFSIFLLVDQVRVNSGSRSQNAFAISGEITESGIINFEQSFIMLDNFGNPFNEYIENGQGRRFIDEDRFSEKITETTNSKKAATADKIGAFPTLESNN